MRSQDKKSICVGWKLQSGNLIVFELISFRRPRKKRAQPLRLDEDESQTVGASRSQSGDSSDSASDDQDAREKVVASAVITGEGLDTETAPLFIGDRQGIGALLHVTQSPASNQKQQQHFMVPRAAAKVLAAEDLEYLKAKGCFSLPGPEVCTALVESYFNFVHPLFPIIDAQEFLGRFEKFGVQQINLLLLWSMFSVSASYVNDSALGKAGYETRKQFKESIVKRAKLLFDVSAENDKIILIQSSLLLGFWFQDAEDVKQSWYWTGIAISIAQTIGLHRNPDRKGGKKNDVIGHSQKRLWRNIWWSCFLRDAWLAFGMGRPVRINTKDCDCPMPTIEDAEETFKGVLVKGNELYAPDVTDFSNLWLELLKVSEGLHEVLRIQYRGNSSPSQIEALRTNISPQFEGPSLEPSTTRNIPLTVASRHMSLHRLAAQIALFRPDTDPTSVARVKDAANAINSILEMCMADETVRFSAPMIIPLVVPAMFSHLMAAKSKEEMKSQLGRHKLDFGLMFLKTLENNYPAAEIVSRLFTAALTIGKKRKESEKALIVPDSEQQSVNEISPDMASATVDANSEDSSFGYSPSGFSLLPMQGPWFDVGMEETGQ